jgi:hypothetical protein
MATVEDRLAAVEAELREVKRRLDELRPAPDWLKRITGSMKDYPEFEEVLRLGREIRRADSPAPDGESGQDVHS